MALRTLTKVTIFLAGLALVAMTFAAGAADAAARVNAPQPTDTPCVRSFAPNPDGRQARLHQQVNSCRSDVGGPNSV